MRNLLARHVRAKGVKSVRFQLVGAGKCHVCKNAKICLVIRKSENDGPVPAGKTAKKDFNSINCTNALPVAIRLVNTRERFFTNVLT
jgi:hypothetical protein